MIVRLLLVCCWPILSLSAQNPVSQAFNYLKVYELSMQESPQANNELAVESLLAAKEEIDRGIDQPPYSKQPLSYLIKGRIYCSMLGHPKGNPSLDHNRHLSIQPAFNALKTYEELSGKPADISLWQTLLKQTFILAFEAEEQTNGRQSIDRSVEGASIVAYLKEQERPLPVANIDESFASLFVQILRRDISTGHLARAGSVIPLTKQWYPEQGELWLTYVNYYIRVNQRDLALEAARKAIPLQQEASDEVRKQLYFTAGNLAVEPAPMEALEYYTAAADIDSNFYGALYNIGVIYARLGQGAATQALEKQELDPARAKQLLNQKVTYFEQALPYLERAYQLQPSAALRENISTIYLDLGNKPKALQWSKKDP